MIVSIFVYVFIGYTVRVSFAKGWQPGKPDFTPNDPWYAKFRRTLEVPALTKPMYGTASCSRCCSAPRRCSWTRDGILVHRVLYAKGFFRGLFLLPYALSFIVTGVVWRWLFNPISGINLLLRNSGISDAYEALTGSPLQPDWVSSPKVVGDVSGSSRP